MKFITVKFYLMKSLVLIISNEKSFGTHKSFLDIKQ